jgi:hypothetical protein
LNPRLSSILECKACALPTAPSALHMCHPRSSSPFQNFLLNLDTVGVEPTILRISSSEISMRSVRTTSCTKCLVHALLLVLCFVSCYISGPFKWVIIVYIYIPLTSNADNSDDFEAKDRTRAIKQNAWTVSTPFVSANPKF